MKNWKTTLFGIISALAGFVAFSPQYFPPVVQDVSKYVLAGGLLGLGLVGKDHNVSGPYVDPTRLGLVAKDPTLIKKTPNSTI